VEEGVLELNPQKEVCLLVSPQSDSLWQGWKRRRGAILEESYAQGLDFDLIDLHVYRCGEDWVQMCILLVDYLTPYWHHGQKW
jgi:hypothetical protein